MTLRERYILARWCYALGHDYISDMEYRYIEDKLKEENPQDELFSRSWSDDTCPVKLLRENGMEDLIRLVEFTHKSESIRSLFDEVSYREQFASLHEETFVSYKIDGWNVQVNYYNGQVVSANTRGRSGNFMRADVLLDIVPKSIPIKGKVKVTGEASIPRDMWVKYSAQTGNTSQRSSVSTVLANKDASFISFKAFNIQTDTEMLEGDRYDMLAQFGFDTPMRLRVFDFASLDKAVRRLASRKDQYNYLTDGVVVENSKGQVALRIYGWQEHSLKSYVTGYIENVGSYGISMVLSVKPVKHEGFTRSKVSVTNIKYIVDNNLRIGMPVAFDIRSAADAVLNVTRTMELQKEWEGMYDEFREMIDASSGT